MSSTDGSPTSTGWNRRSRAGSFSIARGTHPGSWPPPAQLTAGQHGLEHVAGVHGALGGTGAHDRVQFVDERMTWPSALRSRPAPPSAAPRTRRGTWHPPPCAQVERDHALVRSDSGTSPATIRGASPSTTAVLPTPGSPISTGLFLVRRDSTWISKTPTERIGRT